MNNTKYEKGLARKITISGLLIAVGLILPKLFHMVNMAGPIFLPMFYPILIGGLLLGWKYGLMLGVVIPFISSVLTAMPPFYPTAFAMAIQLGTMGAVIGLANKKLNSLVALIIAQVSGNITYCIAMFALLGISGKPFVLTTILTGVFIKSLPGIILLWICIPCIFKLLKRVGVANNL